MHYVQNLHKTSIHHLEFPLTPPPFLVSDLQTPGINKQFGQGSTANLEKLFRYKKRFTRFYGQHVYKHCNISRARLKKLLVNAMN